MRMPTVLLLDNDSANLPVLREVLAKTEYHLTEAISLQDFFNLLAQGPFDLLIISLALMQEERLEEFHRLLTQTPDTKVLALAPFHPGDGLRTLLKAEALRVHHLLATPFDAQKLLSILNITLPISSPQD